MQSKLVHALLGWVALVLTSPLIASAMPGDPIQGVPIGLEGDPGSVVVGTAQTDAAGKFEFKGLKAGKYRLFVAVELNPQPGNATSGGGKQTVIRAGDQLDLPRVFRITNVRANANLRVEGMTELVGDEVLIPVNPETGRSREAIVIPMDGGTILGSFKIADNESPRPQDRGTGVAPADPNAWRYKQQNGEWWYYTDQKQWLVHRNGTWIPYVASGGTAEKGFEKTLLGGNPSFGVIDPRGNQVGAPLGTGSRPNAEAGNKAPVAVGDVNGDGNPDARSVIPRITLPRAGGTNSGNTGGPVRRALGGKRSP